MPFFAEGTSRWDDGLGLEDAESPVAWAYDGGASGGADMVVEVDGYSFAAEGQIYGASSAACGK